MLTYDQTAKKDADKPRCGLVPPAIIEAIGRVRSFGVKKYADPDNWLRVEKERYVDALLRHICKYLRDPKGVDKESGLPHLEHAACNMAFILELDERQRLANAKETGPAKTGPVSSDG